MANAGVNGLRPILVHFEKESLHSNSVPLFNKKGILDLLKLHFQL